eukprot:6336837-Prymnesium_polylepis.1
MAQFGMPRYVGLSALGGGSSGHAARGAACADAPMAGRPSGRDGGGDDCSLASLRVPLLSLIHISEPTRRS